MLEIKRKFLIGRGFLVGNRKEKLKTNNNWDCTIVFAHIEIE
jgi:hypothetical protein